MSNVVLKELLKEYEQKKINNDLALLNRKTKLYEETPRLKEIEEELNLVSISMAKSILLSNGPSLLSDLKNKISNLTKERDCIFKKLGKPKDYLSPIYSCTICKDTGYVLENTTTTMCNCLKQRLFDIEYNKANLSNLKKENFDNFDLNLYSDKIDEQKYSSNISPRQNIKEIISDVQTFINNFDNPEEKNLIFSGGTGLGKTFLSNCIVNKLIKRGKTVLYQTAPVMLDTIISNMFNRNNIKNNISDSLLSVDLLVIDDLGTETVSDVKHTELYKIINTRLLNQNGNITKTIISTNLDLQELFNRYDERLVSRFVGHYNRYHFFGEDIRFKKEFN